MHNNVPERMEYKLSDFQTDKDGTITLKAANINIYEGTIREHLSTDNIALSPLGIGSYWASQDGEKGAENYIAAVAGHEAEHGTSQANLKLIKTARENSTKENIYAREFVPDIIKTNILWESYMKK
jgi:hypothetical protein